MYLSQEQKHKISLTSSAVFLLLLASFLVSCNSDPHLEYDPITDPIAELPKPYTGTGYISAMATSPDGSKLLVSKDGGIYLYDSRTFEEIWQRDSGFNEAVLSLAFSPNGETFLATFWEGNFINEWSTPTGELIARWMESENLTIFKVEVDPENRYIIGEVSAERPPNWGIVWDKITGEPVYVLDDYLCEGALAWNQIEVIWQQDGNPLVAAGCGHTITVYEPATEQIVHILEHEHAFDKIAWSSTGAFLTVGGRDSNSVIIWDMGTGSQQRELPFPVDELSVTGLKWSPDESKIAVGLFDGTVVVWDVESGKLLHHLKEQDDETFVYWSPDSKALYSLSQDATIAKWEISTGQLIHILE